MRQSGSVSAAGGGASPLAIFLAGLLTALILGGACGGAAAAPVKPLPLPEYQASANCRICHERIYEQHQASQHARSFTNPVFQAQYFRRIVPQALADPALAKEANRCVACHSPLTFIKAKWQQGPIREFDPSLAGVACDFCHRIGAYKDKRPGGGNFMSSPGERKFGPFKRSSDWHHVYHELQTKSELCGICHEDANPNGVPIKTTWSEWKASPYAASGIQCQDCHMSLRGFLTDEHPVFDSGRSAEMAVGRSPARSTLYTHRFPGPHAAAEMEGAIALQLGFDREQVVPGEEVEVRVEVKNHRAGHSIPTGSADLRLLWLEVVAAVDGVFAPLAAVTAVTGIPYDLSGAGPSDAAVLGSDVPAGSRLYRAIYVDAAGVQTLASSSATAITFDNRLKAREERQELYRYRVPTGAGGPVIIIARVYYLGYPASFARSLEVANAAPVLMAETQAALPATAAAPAIGNKAR